MLLGLWPNWWENWLLYHKVIFDGANKRIYIADDVTEIDVKIDLYSDWKEWIQLGDNSKYLPAFRATGGDPVGSGLYAGDIYFLINDWQIEVDSVIKVTGILYHDNTNLEPFIVLPGGGVTSIVSNLAIAYSTTGNSIGSAEDVANAVWNSSLNAYGSGTAGNTLNTVNNSINALDIPTVEEVAIAVRDNLTVELAHLMSLQNGLTETQATMLLEIYKLYGLNPAEPLIVTNNSRIVGDISQVIDSNNDRTIVTRVP